jgi:hypothetical protein
MTKLIEDQVGAYATARLGSVPAVTLDEVMATVGQTRRISTRRRRSRLALVGALACSIVLVVIAVGLAGRSSIGGNRSHPAVSSVPSTTLAISRFGVVCGYEFFVGGPPAVDRAPPAAAARKCPLTTSTSQTEESTIVLTGNGKRYLAHFDSQRLWTAKLPAGVYLAVGWGCYPPGEGFVLKAGETLTDVRVSTGCGVP